MTSLVDEAIYGYFLRLGSPKAKGDGRFVAGRGTGPFRLVWKSGPKLFGRELTDAEIRRFGEFVKVKGDPGRNIVAIEASIQSEGIELCYEMIPSGANGVSKSGKIIIDPVLEESGQRS